MTVSTSQLWGVAGDGPDETFQAYEPVGCMSCGNTGYRSRVGLYEVMPVNEEIRSKIVSKATGDEIAAAAIAAGMHRLRDDGLSKVREGLTSIPEVLRVLGT